MSGVSVRIGIDNRAARVLAALRGNLAASKSGKAVGQSVVQLFKAHFTALNTARANRLGGARTNFYANAARGTSWQPVPGGLLVSVQSQGIAQRYFGGTISAKPGGALTIPATADAYGHRAREFNNL